MHVLIRTYMHTYTGIMGAEIGTIQEGVAHRHTRMCVCVYVRVYVRIHTHTYTYIHECTYTYLHTCTGIMGGV